MSAEAPSAPTGAISSPVQAPSGEGISSVPSTTSFSAESVTVPLTLARVDVDTGSISSERRVTLSAIDVLAMPQYDSQVDTAEIMAAESAKLAATRAMLSELVGARKGVSEGSASETITSAVSEDEQSPAPLSVSSEVPGVEQPTEALEERPVSLDPVLRPEKFEPEQTGEEPTSEHQEVLDGIDEKGKEVPDPTRELETDGLDGQESDVRNEGFVDENGEKLEEVDEESLKEDAEENDINEDLSEEGKSDEVQEDPRDLEDESEEKNEPNRPVIVESPDSEMNQTRRAIVAGIIAGNAQENDGRIDGKEVASNFVDESASLQSGILNQSQSGVLAPSKLGNAQSDGTIDLIARDLSNAGLIEVGKADEFAQAVTDAHSALNWGRIRATEQQIQEVTGGGRLRRTQAV